MQVILLERVERLGQMGDVVNVKLGYARNFLLPRQKALRATKENVSYFDDQKKVIEAESLKHKGEAEKISKKMDDLKIVIIRQASEAGQLYGSVTARDIAEGVTEKGFKIDRTQIRMDRNYKVLGLYPIKAYLHPEVAVSVIINIARSVEEAKIQDERGEALITRTDEQEAAAEAAAEASVKKSESEEKARLAAEKAEEEVVKEVAEEAAEQSVDAKMA
ncbi:MAG: 50S ribosomal protein L9 [Alphaproteobacteria bacterium]|nr:50S ribosomal protein L9 [Alphaproteobacteria bacterium]MCK5517847.1 50S ribosomal protein L9 [Alphaproteobacteria bacterium]MCK5556699.1 50S ribosomal protein L9 [Alphaproteobacteria bacterium]